MTAIAQIASTGPYGNNFSISINGWVRCYVTGTREQAEREALRMLAGIEADRRWMARPKCSACDERRAAVSTGPTWFLCAPCLTESNAYDDAHGEPRAIVVPL